jgi:hypothetical protein
MEHICRQRQSYNSTARWAIGNLGSAAVCTRNRIHESKSQPMPVGMFSPDETFKRVLADLKRESWTIVFDH